MARVWCLEAAGVEPLACVRAGITAGEADAAMAAGINLMLWHEVTAGICQLQARRRTSVEFHCPTAVRIFHCVATSFLLYAAPCLFRLLIPPVRSCIEPRSYRLLSIWLRVHVRQVCRLPVC